jgi:magnesium chelatase family protein
VGLARVACRAQVGLAAPPVEVEVHLGSGLPCFHIVGLPATEVKESRERVRAAFATSGFEWPAGRITVNLAPADLPKDGGRFDLAIAVGILRALGTVPAAPPDADRSEFLGELGLDGGLRAVSGALPALQAAGAAGHELIVPRANAAELAPWSLAPTRAAPNLGDVVAHLSGGAALPSVADASAGAASGSAAGAASGGMPDAAPSGRPGPAPGSLDDVCGQLAAKRALLVAAAGGHSLLLVGPPGCGKTMLAQRLRGLLPPLTPAEQLEVATIASVASTSPALVPVPRPFRAPHHTASAGAIVGGGPRAQPGEVTLAHRGVLFLDELPEFDRRVLEALREPLECGAVTIARAALRAEYPARFQLVAAMNPCPCGHHGDARRACRCPPPLVAQYRARISGPLLDRIDLRVALQSVSEADLAEHRARAREAGAGPDSSERIAAARARQRARGGLLNAELDGAALEAALPWSRAAGRVLDAAHRGLGLSMRALTRVRRIALTLADLDAAPAVAAAHAAEAVQLRRGIDA